MEENEKQLKRYKHEVHCYLDILWLIATDKNKARRTWYSYLAIQLNKNQEENHVSQYNLEDCRKALRLLKNKYKEITGRNNMPKSIRKKFYQEKDNRYNLQLLKGGF